MEAQCTRRSFLSKAALGVAGSAALGLSAGPALAAEGQDIVAPDIVWNGLYDVVIIGFGGAGAAAAITAADAGAKVLLVDKAPKGHEGGNTRYCMQVFMTIDPAKQEQAISYYQDLRGRRLTPSDELIETWVAKVAENVEWLQGLGGNPMALYETYPGEYPEYESDDSLMPMTLDGARFDSGFWRFISGQVAERADSIDVWYETPATRLIRASRDGAVLGVTVEVNGAEANIRARNGVVLACGGFEANLQMIQDHTALSECYAMGGQYNTGDGVRMAAEIGANIWHMENIMGPYLGTMRAGASRPEFYSGTMMSGLSYKGGFMFVGPDGTRFVDESYNPRHGYIDFHGAWMHTPAPQPMYMVFDQTCLEQSMGIAGPAHISQSIGVDSIEECVAEGTALRADSVDELAGLMSVAPEALVGTMTTFNEACAQGADVQHGRRPETLTAFAEAGPYYAVELHPHIINTQGGPERNARAEIVDATGEPIAHLYGAGECGAIFSGPYQGASNIADCIAMGRIAGENAAATKDDEQPGDDLVVETVVPEPAAEQTFGAGEGQYVASADGICGPVTVRVTMDGDVIASVEVLADGETDTFGGLAIKAMPERFVGLSADDAMGVDGVAGATITSSAIKLAVSDAAGQANK